MQMHETITESGTTFALVETHAPAVGVMNVGDMVCVRIVSMPQRTEYKSVRTKGVVEHQKQVLFKRGPRYATQVQAMKEAMAELVAVQARKRLGAEA